MVAKALWASILVVGILAMGGLGYSMVTLTATSTINGTAGSWSVGIDNYNVVTSTHFYPTTSAVTCTVAPPASGATSIVGTASNLGPGDWCTLFVNFTNTGSIPILYTGDSATLTSASATCWQAAPELPVSGGVTVAPGGTIATQITLELTDSAGAGCNGPSHTASYVVTFDFQAGVGENGEPGNV
jgi:hypothetical protein